VPEAQGKETDVQEQEAAQEPQEAPVTVPEAQGKETDVQEQEAAQEPQEAPVTAQGLTLGSGRLGGVLSPAVVTPTPTLLTSSAPEENAQESDEEYDTILVNDLETVKLGRQGEHLTQQVLIDCSAWLSNTALTGCQLLIAAIRPGENEIYLPIVTTSNGVITWDIRDQDTAKGGWGRGEVRAMKDGKIKKSAVFRTRVEPSLEGSGGGTPVTPPDWAQAILESVTAAQAAAEAAAASAAQAELNTRGLAGWSLTKEQDDTVTIDYNEESEG